MTKKELLDSDEFRTLPDDAEIVFATDGHLGGCVPMNALNLSVVRQSDKTAMVVDAIPYWYLKERFGVVLGNNQKMNSEESEN